MTKLNAAADGPCCYSQDNYNDGLHLLAKFLHRGSSRLEHRDVHGLHSSMDWIGLDWVKFWKILRGLDWVR